MLVSPHTQWYDGGLVLLAVLLGLDLRLRFAGGITAGDRLLLLVGYLLPLLFGMGETLGFQPMILLPLVSLAWVYDSPTKRVGDCAPQAHSNPASHQPIRVG